MCANYSSRANKPDQSLYQRRLMTSIKRLPAGCDFKPKPKTRAGATTSRRRGRGEA
jgi:hypothetical protein